MVKICCKVILVLLASSFAAGLSSAEEGPLDKLNLTASFVRSKDQVTKPVPASALTVTTATVGPNDVIADLLRRNGIFPNNDALAVTYTLNPDLAQLSPLPEKLSLVLPALKKTDEVNQALKEGFLASLVLDRKLKDDLTATWKSFQGLVMQMSAFGAERFSQPDDKSKVITALEDTTESLHAITIAVRENNRPLSHEILSQTYNEAALLLSIVQEVAQPGGKLSPENQDRILLIAADMDLKMRNLNEARGPNESPLRWRDTRVVVEVVQDQKPVLGLRVYYVPEALAGHNDFVHQFGRLSSPSEEVLPEADYIIWAAKEDNSTIKTGQAKVSVRKSAEGTKSVQLTLVH